MTPEPLFACLYRPPVPGHVNHGTPEARGALLALAQDFSPRFEVVSDDVMAIDVSGLDRLLGAPRVIGEELRRSAADRGLRVHVALAATRTAAILLAHARPGLTVVDQGREANALAPIRVEVLEKIAAIVQALGTGGRREAREARADAPVPIFRTWGVKTLGELAALPSADLAARLGQHGLAWQAAARGEDVRPLVPALPDESFDASIELEWPIDGLEPLSFVLTRLLEPLSTRLERRDRGAAALHVTLGLVKYQVGSGESGKDKAFTHPTDQTYPTHLTSLQLPAPMRDVRALRTLILLDLESHPPPAAVERVAVRIDPTPGRVLQHALFTRAHPTPEQLSTLVSRLTALMGRDRLGCPVLVDSHRPGAFEMMPFAIEHHEPRRGRGSPISASHVVSALKRCRRPVPARVTVAEGRPFFVASDRRGFTGGCVRTCSGPWRSSGEWWGSEGAHHPTSWDRDEWDVALGDGAVYRIFQDRDTDRWFIDAIAD